MKIKKLNLLALALLFGLTGCGKNTEEIKTDSNVNSTSNEIVESSNENTSEEKIVKLTTTTSVNDSGLMDYLRDDFKKDTGLEMEIVSKGTGAAIEDAKAGNADVILVHSKDAEEKFIEEGYGLERKSFMHNFFVIVGPKDDPAVIKGKDAEDAFKAISDSASKFVSRGDESGTHNKEKKIWEAAGVDLSNLETMDNYNSLGDGMGATLTFASENNAYTLTDLSTFLTMENDLDLEVLVDQSDALKNVYSIIIVNPDKVKGTNPDVAKKFQDWMLSDKASKLISEYGKEEYGQQLFFLGE